MKRQLVTYKECQEIVAKNENFYEKVEVIEGTKVSVFNYILSIPEYFAEPFPGSEVSAYELRGITFVHEETGPKRYLMLAKFFNINETAGFKLNDVKNKKIVRIQDKLDGSMIRFIRVGDRVVVKTKNGYNNLQTEHSMALYNANLQLQSFVKETLDQGLAAVFEYIGPMNQIVISYNKAELRLIQLREESTGKFLDIYDHELVKKYSVATGDRAPLFTFEELLQKQETELGVEGWIVTLDDGQMLKVKTLEYFKLHTMLDNVSHEQTLVELICTEKIDDALSLLDEKNERRQYAERMQQFIAHHIREMSDEVQKLMGLYSGDRKSFAIANKENPLFHVAVKLIGKPFDQDLVVKSVKDTIMLRTKKLNMARTYLQEKGFPVGNYALPEEG